jgi:multicomponent Na+:H+ antiporter subunit E
VLTTRERICSNDFHFLLRSSVSTCSASLEWVLRLGKQACPPFSAEVKAGNSGHGGNPSIRIPRYLPFLLTFVLLFALWVVLSGKFDVLHLTLGIISSALVGYFSGDLLFSSMQGAGSRGLSRRFVLYIPWLIYQILLSSLHLLRLSFHPRMKSLIEPKIIRFRSRLKGDLALVTFANSITLTPGTITVSVSIDGDFRVHAIDRESAESLPGEMEARIAAVFEGE